MELFCLGIAHFLKNYIRSCFSSDDELLALGNQDKIDLLEVSHFIIYWLVLKYVELNSLK